MADGYELSLDIDVSTLKQADNKIKDMITHTTELHRAMSAVFGNIDVAKLGMALGKVQNYFNDLSKSKVSPNVDTTKLEHLYDVMGDIIGRISAISSIVKKFHDTNKVHTTSEGLWDVERNIARINRELEETKKLWNATFDLTVDKSKFQAPVHTDGKLAGKAFGKTSDTYKQAYAEWEKLEKAKLAAAGAEIRKRLEEEREALQEELKDAQDNAELLKKTAAERTDYVIAQTQREVREKNKLVREHQREYAKVLADMRKSQNQIAGFEKENIDGQNDVRIQHLENRYIELNEKRKRLEQDYGQFLVEIAEKHNADILAIEAKRIKAKRQLENELWQKELETPEGALMSAEYAKTIDEMKQAQKNVLAARNKTDVNDVETIQDLNNAYIKLRATIEDLTKAEKNEQSLQPTLRNEYMRLRKELDKVQEAFKKGEDSDAWQSFAKGASKDDSMDKALDALIAREEDLQRRINEIKEQAGNRLDEVDRQFEAEKAQREIAETERVEKEKAAIRAKHLKDFSDKMNRYGAVSSSQVGHVLSSANKSQNLIQEEAAIKKLLEAKARLNRNDENYEKTLAKLDKAIADHTHQVKMLTDETYRQKEAEKIHTTYDGALKYKKEARTLKDQIKAIEYLKIARQNLDRVALGESEYNRQMKQLNEEIRRSQREVNKLQEDFNNFNSKAGDLIGQLSRRMALLFSVSAIEGYVQKIASIRGEFEIQQRSLQVLIGSQEEANKIWEQTVALAVKSPFRVKELVTYTKQLAAYRIETEKLHGTTKMLADVSSGLGVDMNRLILAYGQVKAANYLRGTELRQFSEAGVNLLKDLADYFTVVEGRAVSVAQVFDRVSKRMVTFEHVDTIIRNMTSEGGQFYKMQEKQAETLAGMRMNFKDSMDLMMNDIGKDYEGALKTSISLAKTLVEQWRTIVPFIKGATMALAIYAAKMAWVKMASMALSHPYLLAISAVAGLTYTIYDAYTAQSKLNAEMERINTEVTKSLEEHISLYHKLVEVYNDATKSNQERNNALTELQTKFKDILPQQLLEIEYIQQISEGYKEAEDALMDYYNSKAREQKRDYVESQFASELEGTDIPELISTTKDWIEDMFEIGEITAEQKIRLTSGVGGIVHSLVEDVKQGKIAADFDILSRTLKKRLEVFSEVDLDNLWNKVYFGFDTRNEDLTDIIATLRKYRNALEGIEGLSYETYDQVVADELIKKEKKNVEIATDAFKKAAALYGQYINAIPTATKSIQQQRKEIEEDVQQIITNLPVGMAKYTEYLKVIFGQMKSSADEGAFAFQSVLQSLESQLYATEDEKGAITGGFAKIALDNVILNESANDAAKQMIDNFKKGLSEKSKNLKMTDFQNAVIEGAVSIADRFGQSTEIFQSFVPKYGESLDMIRKEVQATIDGIKTRVKEMNQSLTQGLGVLSWQVMSENEAQLRQLEQQLPALEAFSNFLGNLPNNTNGSAGKDWFAEMGKAIRDTHKDFLTLHKDLNKTRALELAMEKHSDVFAEAAKGAKMVGLSLRDFSSLLVEDNAISALEDLLVRIPETASKSRLAIEKMIGELKGGEEVRKAKERYEELNSQIEQLFGTYELSLELQDMNISKDLAEKLFGFESIDLSELRQKVLSKVAPFDTDKSDKEIIEKLKKQGVDEERIKLTKDTLKKIAEIEKEAQQKRLKEYVAFARGAIGERAKVKMEEMQKLEDIEKTFAEKDSDSEETKETKNKWRLQAIAKARQEANDAIKKLDWEAFKSSDTFNMVFDDLDRAGQESLNNMIDKLKEFRNQWKDMPFDQMRQVTDLLQKAEEAYYSKSSPFAEARRLRKAIREDGRTEEQALLDLSSAEQELVTLDNIIAKIQLFQQIKDGLASTGVLSTEDTKLYNQYLSDSLGFYIQQTQHLSDQQEILKEIYLLKYMGSFTDENIIDLLVEQGKLTKDEAAKAKKRITDADRLKQKYQEQATAIGQMQQMANDLYDSFYGLATNVTEFFGSEISETGKIFAEAGQEMMNTVFATLELQKGLKAANEGATEFEKSLNSAMGIVGWIVMAVQIISKVFSVFTQLHDNKLQEQIENITDKVETLRKAFERLEKQMDEAYQIDTINDVAKRGQENLEQQIESTRKMIALEQEKKDTDEDKIKEWQDEIEDANEKLKELEIERRQALGGLGGQADYKSASEAFVDAWLTAFRETGDGMQGLEERYDEMMTNMIKKQLTTRVADQILAQFYSYFDSMFDETSKGGARVTEDELRRLEQLKEDALMQMNDQLSALSTIFGNDIMGQVELGTLQKGIQGITEQQADILASYLNTIRFFVAEQNSYLQDIAMAQGVSQRENPMVEHLKVVAEQTTAIHELLDNLLVPHPTQSGRGLKVVI